MNIDDGSGSDMMEINQHKKKKVLTVKNLGQCIGCYSCMLTCATMVHKNFGLHKSAITIKTSGGYPGRMVVNICRGCIEGGCLQACNQYALEAREGGGVIYHKEKCVGCKNCLDACTVMAIGFDEDEKKAIICRQCGLCVKSCPHDVIGMVEIK